MFRIDEGFDVRDLMDKLVELTPEDGGGMVTEGNRVKLERFLEWCFSFAEMRGRKNRKEEEAYRMANASRLSWAAEKKYRADDIFKDDEEDEKLKN